jgi:fatty-acyl-CoA synthase
VATSARKLDRAGIEAQVFDIARQLLTELGSQHGVEAIRGSAHLDRDLGLGSLERVELFVRLDRAFGSHLPERVVAEADTLDDVIAALAATTGADTASLQDNRRTSSYDASSYDAGRGAKPSSGGQAAAPAWAETWQDVIRYRAAEDAGRTHLILWDDAGEAQRISFGELHEGARRAAAEIARHGVGRGDAVALMLPTGREFFLTFAGVLLAGGVPVPIYPPVRADRIAEYAERQSAILRNAEARLLITFDEAARVAKLLQPSVKSLRGSITAATLLAPGASAASSVLTGDSPDTVRASASDLALLQYTSGSTGDPKGVVLTHANLLANIRAIGEALAIAPDDVGVSWLPLYHDMGLIGAWLMPLYFGLPVAVLSPISFLSRPERWLWAMHKHAGTLTAAPNFAYELAVRKVADADIEGLDLSTLRAALNGAEPVNAETLDRFAERFGRYGLRREALMPVYGLAEASLAVTMPPPGRGPRVDRIVRETFAREGRAVSPSPAPREDDPSNTRLGDPGLLSVVSVGHPVPDHEVRIVNAEGQDVPERVEGALWFRGPSTTSGYFHNAAASSALFPEGQGAGWLNSGDRGYRADGEIFITGRVKDLILKAGRNLYPHEIEEITGGVAGVRKGCVVAFGAADATAGTERLVVVAETRERDSAARQRIAAAITQSVATTMGLPPDAVELLPPHSIPKTSSGKLRRNQARELYLAGTLGTAAPPAWLQVARLAMAGGARTVGQWVRSALESLYGVYAAAGFVLWLIPAWLLVSVMPNRRAAARFTSAAIKVYLAFAGIPVRVVGREHWRTPGPRVIVSNHTSYFDVLALMGALGVDYHFVAKREVQDIPFIGTFLRKLEHFAFDRSDSQARLRQASEIESALRRGESVFVFPEGTFSPQTGVRPFQLGAFKAAATAHCPILPVALAGTRRFLRDGSYLPHPARITITICPPLNSIGPTGPIGPPDSSNTGEPEWREIVRLRDAAREQIARISGEPLL